MPTVRALVIATVACSPATPRPSAGADAPAVAEAPRDAASRPAVPPDAAPSGPAIIDAPIAWSEQRAELTLEYRRAHSDPAAQDLTIEPRVIVLHYTGGGSL